MVFIKKMMVSDLKTRMKAYILTLIFVLTVQRTYCLQDEPIDLACIYYADHNDHLINVFSHAFLTQQLSYSLSDIGFFKIVKKKLWNDICSFFYITQTPYVFLNQQDVKWSFEKYGNYYVCNDQYKPCPLQ